MAGRTDEEIALEILERNGVSEGERHLAGFTDALGHALAAKAELIAAHGKSHAGAHAAISRLAAEPGVLQSLLTGNIESNAAIKLGAVGLLDHLDLEIGGYGSDHRVRFELVTVARRRARDKYGVEFSPEQTVLIGDTPLDVAAARQTGARVVAVASGFSDLSELEGAGPDYLLPDLLDAEALVSAVRGSA
jgi:phosphoglycolate phosphatase-like HAD superfamily hydrolase